MQYVKTNTAILLCVGPFLDKTDGVTPETGSMAASTTTMIAETDAGSAPTIVLDNVLGNDATNPVTHITNDDAGYYYLTLTAANLNRLGRCKIGIMGPATHCPVFHELMILPAMVYDSMVLGTDVMDASVTQWLGQGVAAVTVNGVPEVDVTHWNGTAVSAPATAGIPEVNLKNIANAAVSASTAQLGVNIVNYAGSAVGTPDTAGYPKVTVKSGAGTGEISTSSGGVTLSTSGLGAVAGAVLDESLTGHIAANSLGGRLQFSHSGACQAGGSGTTVVLASSASSVDDYYNGDLIFGYVTADRTNFFTDYISDYTGSSRTATVTGIPVSPGATYSYFVIPGGTIPGASAPSAADNAAAVWNKLTADHVTEATFGAAIGAQIAQVGTLQAGGTSSVTLDATGASATNNAYKYCTLEITSGTGAGECAFITGYTASSKVVTLDPALSVDPSTANYVIRKLGIDASTPASVATAVWAATRAGNATAGSFGEYGFADMTRISGDATAADNLEAMVDGTGLTLTNVVVPSVTTVTGNVNGNVGGNVTGSVGSVTGAVGSVTGAVGSVTGAVASVTAGVTVTTNNDKTGYALSNAGVDALFTRALTESYAADGAAPTVAQALMMIQQRLGDFAITGTTLTLKKVDGATTAATFTLNDATSPTSITRAT